MTDTTAPVINDDADRLLGRIIVRHGMATIILLLAMTFVMAFVNALVPGPLHRFLDTLSILLVLVPFFVGTNRLFAARLGLGRTYVGERRWREAIAALDPFAGQTQRFLDTTGEAHYLLSLAYQGAGDSAKAEAARLFLRQHRRGAWAEKLASRAPHGQEKRPRPVKRAGRRRF